MFTKKKSSPRQTAGATPGGSLLTHDASSLLTHDVGKERKFRTKVHRKTLNPVFNEVFLVRGVLGALVSGPLAVKVLDSDALSKDDMLGTLELELESLGAEGGDDSVEWANEPLVGAPHGTLSVRVSWAAAPKTGRHALVSTPRLEQHGTLSVHVIEAIDLIAADKTASDPYVKLELTGLSKGNVLQQVRGLAAGAVGDVKQGVAVLATEGAAKVETAAGEVETAATRVVAKVRALGKVEVPTHRVEEPTPDDLYFTPRNGWIEAKKAHAKLMWLLTPPGDYAPSGEGAHERARRDGTRHHSSAQWNPPPPSLVPHKSEAEALYHDEGIIGELRVEVLEAEHLMGGGAIDVADPYAVLVVEGYAARTSTVQNNHAPRWPSDAPRAFRFPLRRPYACLYIGLMDDDSQARAASLTRPTLPSTPLARPPPHAPPPLHTACAAAARRPSRLLALTSPHRRGTSGCAGTLTLPLALALPLPLPLPTQLAHRRGRSHATSTRTTRWGASSCRSAGSRPIPSTTAGTLCSTRTRGATPARADRCASA